MITVAFAVGHAAVADISIRVYLNIEGYERMRASGLHRAASNYLLSCADGDLRAPGILRIAGNSDIVGRDLLWCRSSLGFWHRASGLGFVDEAEEVSVSRRGSRLSQRFEELSGLCAGFRR